MSVCLFVCFLSFGFSCIPVCFGLLFSSLFLIKFCGFIYKKEKNLISLHEGTNDKKFD